ncbi:MAG TPA: GDSL-type esterase/lipase family protein [Elusimicrobiales bacterium]|nr:GDSL-type esterase/lipase family protein [Elusimicrobiales bacterium]
MPPEENIPPLPKARKGGRALALLLGAVFAVLGAEAALRLGGLAVRLKQESVNRASLSSGTSRILCLGESTTAGGTDAWPARLERILAARYPAARVSVINKGVAGFNTSDLLRNLEKDLDAIRPDLVIAMMGINDGFKSYYQGIPDAESPLFRHFRLYKLFRILLNNYKTAGQGAPPGPAQGAPLPAGPLDPYTPFQGRTYDIAQREAALAENIGRDPGDIKSLYLLGRYWTLGKGFAGRDTALRKKGEALLLRAARLDPKNSFVYWTLGIHYRELQDLRRARLMLEKAAELAPSAENWHDLGKVYRLCGLPAEAEAALLKAADLGNFGGAREAAFFELNWLYLSRRDFSKAEALLHKGLARYPDNEKITGALAALYAQSGRPALAREYAEKLTGTRTMFTAETRRNFTRLRRLLQARGMRLAVMQYPLCDPTPLRGLFEDPGDIIFISNEPSFRDAVEQKGYPHYFVDMFAGNFGHCTDAGNELIAANAAAALAPYFGGSGTRLTK